MILWYNVECILILSILNFRRFIMRVAIVGSRNISIDSFADYISENRVKLFFVRNKHKKEAVCTEKLQTASILTSYANNNSRISPMLHTLCCACVSGRLPNSSNRIPLVPAAIPEPTSISRSPIIAQSSGSIP